MATNVVSLVSRFLTPDSIGRVSNALGLDRTRTQSAIGVAIPSLLAGLATIVARSEGGEKVAEAVRQQGGKLDRVASMLGTGRQAALARAGSQLLSALFGSRNESALAEAVGSFSGIGRGPATSLLGMLAPIVMGSVARQLGSGFDAHTLKHVLVGQRHNIAAALPSGFASELAGADILDSVASTARHAGAAHIDATTSTVLAASYAVYTSAEAHRRAATGAAQWLYWIVVLLALTAAGIYVAYDRRVDEIRLAANLPQGLMVHGVDLGKTMLDSLDGLRRTLSSVRDVPSARKALPNLRDIAMQIDKIAGLEAQLAPAQRAALTGMRKRGMISVSRLSQGALAIPGVADVLKPSLDTLMQKLGALET